MTYLINKTASTIVLASNKNPIVCVVTVCLFWLMLSGLEAMLEGLIFGEPFPHWLDPFIALAAICYAAYTVWLCAAYQLATPPTEGE